MGVENIGQVESPEQNEQQKKISIILQAYKNKSLEALTNNYLLKIYDDHMLELEVALHNEPSKIKQFTDKFDEFFSTIQTLQNFEGNANGFNEFVSIIYTLDNNLSTSLLKAIKENNPIEISTYFSENGFPINKLEFQLLNRKLGITIDNYPAIELNEYKLYNIDEANMEKLIDIYNGIQSVVDPSEVFILLKSLSKGNKEAYAKLKNVLLSQPDELEKLLNVVLSVDKENDTNHYETLKYTLFTIDPAFKVVINRYENRKQEKMDSLYKAHVYSLSGVDPKMKGGFFESNNNYGNIISIDLRKKPPYRTLALGDSEYTLEANRDLGELHKPHGVYQKRKLEISEQLKTVNMLQATSIQEHIADLVNHEYQLHDVKRHLRLVYGINVDFIDSLDELASIYNLDSKRSELETELKNAEKQYNIALNASIMRHREKIFEQDEKTRKILEFISDIGLDLLPKEKTDQIINEVKTGLITVEDMNLNPTRLDLKSGCFGESPTETGSNQWKENLIMFFNKMISGARDSPIVKEMHLGVSGKFEDRIKMRHLFMSSGITTSSGTFNIELARKNLKTRT